MSEHLRPQPTRQVEGVEATQLKWVCMFGLFGADVGRGFGRFERMQNLGKEQSSVLAVLESLGFVTGSLV